MATTSRVRTPLLATIGLLWLTAASLILLSTAASRTDRLDEVSDLRAACVDGLTGQETTTSLTPTERCDELLGKLARYSYPVRTAAIWLLAITLLAGVAWALTVVWGRTDDEISDKDRAVDSLRRLKQLRDEGILTEAEYQDRRSKELPGLD